MDQNIPLRPEYPAFGDGTSRIHGRLSIWLAVLFGISIWSFATPGLAHPYEGEAPEGGVEIFSFYLWLGLVHIVPRGFDHVLFVLGLFLLSTKLSALLWQISAFTLAHTVTLALSMTHVIAAPQYIVEPLIAASIVWVGVENVFADRLYRGRIALVFGFGLLHGLGFAGVLHDYGIAGSDFVTGLIAFNVGVELGQLAVVAAAYLVVGWAMRTPAYRRTVAVPGSIAIACIALYWTMERVGILA